MKSYAKIYNPGARHFCKSINNLPLSFYTAIVTESDFQQVSDGSILFIHYSPYPQQQIKPKGKEVKIAFLLIPQVRFHMLYILK